MKSVVLRELSDIYTNPNNYIIQDWCSDRGNTLPLSGNRVTARRSNDTITFSIDCGEEQHRIVILPMTVGSVERYRLLRSRLADHRNQLIEEITMQSAHFISRQSPTMSILADVVTYSEPSGISLPEYLATHSEVEQVQRIYSLIRLMESELELMGLAILDINPLDIVYGADGLLYPIHYDTLTIAENSTNSFEELRKWLLLTTNVTEERWKYGDDIGSYKTIERPYVKGYKWSGQLHDDRIVVENEEGFGYVDGRHNIVIAVQYKYAGAFAEGRAIVEGKDGWGLINLWGENVIPPIYESLGYNPNTGISCVKYHDEWSYFSYRGEQITPFKKMIINEEITLEEVMKLV